MRNSKTIKTVKRQIKILPKILSKMLNTKKVSVVLLNVEELEREVDIINIEFVCTIKLRNSYMVTKNKLWCYAIDVSKNLAYNLAFGYILRYFKHDDEQNIRDYLYYFYCTNRGIKNV